MPASERVGARSRCWVAPVGADPSDKAAWAELPVTDAGVASAFTVRWDTPEMLSLQDRANQSLVGAANAAKGWKPAGLANEMPTWLRSDLRPRVDAVAVAAAKLASGHYSGFQQRWMTGIDPQTFPKINERSKPMGLNDEYTYESPRGNNRKLYIEGSAFDKGVYVRVMRGGEGEASWVAESDTIPLALNVLGYDRPGAGASVQAAVGHSVSGYTSTVINGPDSRDRLLARAAANLLAIDAYDQRQAERKAEEEAKAKAEAEAAAKAARDAEYARHKRESYDRAKVTYADAIRDQIASGITPESVAKVQAALSAFETARRKLEGLPN